MKAEWKWYQCLILVLGLLILVLITVYVAVKYNSMPQEIPAHFKAAGEADDAFGAKSSISFPLVMAWLLYMVLSILQFFPQAWNTGVKITPENRERVLSILWTMLCTLTTGISAFFAYTIYCAVQGSGLYIAAVPAFLFLVFGTGAGSLILVIKNR